MILRRCLGRRIDHPGSVVADSMLVRIFTEILTIHPTHKEGRFIDAT